MILVEKLTPREIRVCASPEWLPGHLISFVDRQGVARFRADRISVPGRQRDNCNNSVPRCSAPKTRLCRKLADLDRLCQTVSKVKGRIDIIFANASVGEFVPFPKVSEEHFDKLFNINVKGAFFTVQKGLPLFKARLDVLTGPLGRYFHTWRGREDLNLHTLSGTCTSSMRVCQFRHDR
jgi:NAD(P)-dependent dehydrogenase (short-subunit alcohol dehydrogenase family)